MKTTNNSSTRRHTGTRRTALTAARCLCILTAACLSFVLAACTPDNDDDPGKTGKPITITALRTEILAPGANTRAFTTEPDEKGYTPGGVKVKFVAGDVLHLIAGMRNSSDNTYSDCQFANATLGSDGRTWIFDSPLVFTQGSGLQFAVLYDGKDTRFTEYNYDNKNEDNLFYAFQKASWPSDFDPNASGPFSDAHFDVLAAGEILGFSSVTVSSDGTLSLQLDHTSSLVRISGISNQLSAAGIPADAVVGISANISMQLNGNGGSYPVTLSLTSDGTDPAGTSQWQVLCGGSNYHGNYSYNLQSFTVCLGTPGTPANPDGTGGTPATVTQTVTVNVPADPNRPDESGRRLTTGYSYTYRLTLLPGSASVATEENGTPDAWEAQRDPAVPAGYIPIYTAEELRKVGRAISGSGYSAVYETATVNGYTYTTTADATGQPLTYSLNAKYILMADIDLTPTLPNGQRGVRNIAVTKPVLDGNGNVSTAASLNSTDFDDDMKALKPTDSSGTPSEELWTPIGSGSNNFEGHFNGNGHTITGMTINSDAQYVGLFGNTYNALIYNLHLRDARVKSTYSGNSSHTGTLVGLASGSSNISLCSATGCTVQATRPAAGGLIGNNSDYSTLTRCHATGCIVSSGDTQYPYGTGDLMGNSYSTTVACYTSGCTAQGKYAGGLAGYFIRNVLYGCYAADAGAIKIASTDSTYSGTLVGYAYNSSSGSPAAIASCYATNTGDYTTGLMGSCDTSSLLLTACISPFQNSSSPGASDASTTDDGLQGIENDGIDQHWGSYWGQGAIPGTDGSAATTTGYNPLIPDTTTGTALGGLHSGGKTFYDGSSFNSDGNLTNVPTIVVNASTGALEVQTLIWKASRIWKGLQSATSPVTSAPYIDWTYAGGD